jgi:oxygen-independent coproporphyrinogen-3 oxidase
MVYPVSRSTDGRAPADRDPDRPDNIGAVERFTSRDSLGIYVHIPFCERVCPYCDFAVEAVGAVPASLEADYLALVVRELDRVRSELPELIDGRLLETVYLGGGTPSLLSPAGVEGLLAAIRARLFGDPAEVTLELNPARSECARAPALRSAGVSRLSIGVQSFDDATLKRLGRAHRGAEALRGLEACLGAGFHSLSVDLIYAAPGQTEEALLADVARVADLGIPHVSAYALTVEPGTPFARAQERGILALPDEDTGLRMMRTVRAGLYAAGYRQYEISNFARPGHRACHNLRYWRQQDVLGLGVSSAGLLGRLRTRNVSDRRAWADAVASGRLPWEEVEHLSALDVRREMLFLGFRLTDGIQRADYVRRQGCPPEEDFASELRELRELGLIEEASGALRPTERGILFSNDVLSRFVGVDPPSRGG